MLLFSPTPFTNNFRKYILAPRLRCSKCERNGNEFNTDAHIIRQDTPCTMRRIFHPFLNEIEKPINSEILLTEYINCTLNVFCTFQTDRGLVAMLKKHGKELSETNGGDWLDTGFVLGVIMDLTAAGNTPGLISPT